MAGVEWGRLGAIKKVEAEAQRGSQQQHNSAQNKKKFSGLGGVINLLELPILLLVG